MFSKEELEKIKRDIERKKRDILESPDGSDLYYIRDLQILAELKDAVEKREEGI